MKLTKVILENFRSFKERITIDIDDLTAFKSKYAAGYLQVIS